MVRRVTLSQSRTLERTRRSSQSLSIPPAREAKFLFLAFRKTNLPLETTTR